MITSFKPLDLPVAGSYRLRLREIPHEGPLSSTLIVGLEQRNFGPFWRELDVRSRGSYGELDPSAQEEVVRELEVELLEDWFAEELRALRK